MTEILGTIATVIAVAGVLLNNRQNRACFVLWMLSNLVFGYIHAEAGMISLVGRDIIFYLLAIEGFRKWTNKAIINA